MLLSLMMQLNMFGSGPTPTPPDHGGGSGGKFHREETEVMDKKDTGFELERRLLQDDEDFIIIISSWLANKNNN